MPITDGSSKPWALRMQRLLRRACHAVNLAQARGEPLKPRFVERFQCRYDAITAAGLAFHEALPPRGSRGRPRRRTGHNLLLRLTQRREDVLRFLTDPRVPFTNNLATAKKQGWNVIHTLSQSPASLIAQLRIE